MEIKSGWLEVDGNFNISPLTLKGGHCPVWPDYNFSNPKCKKCEIVKSLHPMIFFSPPPHQCFLFLEINCCPSKHPISVKTINQSYCQVVPKLFPRIIFRAPYFMGKGVLSRKEENMFLPKWAILRDRPTLLMIWMGH